MKLTKSLKINLLVLCFVLMVSCLFLGLTTFRTHASGEMSNAGFYLRVRSSDEENVDKNGIRFSVKVNGTDDGNGGYTNPCADYKVYVAVIPNDLLSGAELLATTPSAKIEEVTNKWVAIDNGETFENFVCLYNISKSAYDRDITWRFYYSADGAEPYTYLDPVTKRIADVALTASQDPVYADYVDDIKQYYTANVIYDLGVREDGSTTEWKTSDPVPYTYNEVSKDALIDDTNIPTGFKSTEMPTRDGLRFVGWKVDESAIGTVGDIKVEAMWLLTKSLNLTSAEQLLSMADVEGGAWKPSTSEDNKLIFTMGWNSGANTNIKWKNLVTPNKNTAFNISISTTNSKDANGTVRNINFGYLKNGTTYTYLLHQNSNNGSSKYSYNDTLTATTSGVSAFAVSSKTSYNELVDFQINNSNNSLAKDDNLTFDSFIVATNVYDMPTAMQYSETGKTIINPISYTSETPNYILQNDDGSGNITSLSYKNLTSATGSTRDNVLIFLFEQGTKLEVNDKVVFNWENAPDGAGGVYQISYNVGDGKAVYVDGDQGSYLRVSTHADYKTSYVDTITATKARNLTAIYVHLAGTQNSADRNMTVYNIYIEKA